MEGQIAQEVRELLRQAAESGAQRKADATPPLCPVCQKRLSRLSDDQPRAFDTQFGPGTVRRTRGYCKRCRKWRGPADTALGLEDTAGYSPVVQEMAALLVSKMPVSEASVVLQRLTGSAQCRFKRPGQFWSKEGDEALLCLETFWRNGRWHLLFPHALPHDPARN